MTANVINVSTLVDERRVTGYNIKVLAWCFFIMLCDGFDLGVLSFAAPSILKEWAVTDRTAMGSVFSASIMGILFGSLLFGYIGDRFGRRNAIVSALATIGLASLAVSSADTLGHLFWLRFITGLGLGGLFPNVAALGAEFAPKKFRATLLILGLIGVTVGVAIPGMLAGYMVPTYGWRSLFILGGLGPLVMAAICMFALPESPLYLALRPKRRDELVKLIGKLRPDLSVDPSATFTLNEERRAPGISPRPLFKDGLGSITVLLWICFASNLMGYYFLISWLPTLLQGAAISPGDANFTTILLQLGGVTGGLLLCRPMDRIGVLPIAFLFLVATLTVGAIGSIGGGANLWLLQTVVFFAGFSVLSLQFGLDAFAAIIYQTSMRAVGAGWAFLIGRIGSVVGPIVGGMMIARKVPMDQLFFAAAVPLAIGTASAILLLVLYTRRTGGYSMYARSPAAERAGV